MTLNHGARPRCYSLKVVGGHSGCLCHGQLGEIKAFKEKGEERKWIYAETTQLVGSDGLSAGLMCWASGVGSWGREVALKQFEWREST